MIRSSFIIKENQLFIKREDNLSNKVARVDTRTRWYWKLSEFN